MYVNYIFDAGKKEPEIILEYEECPAPVVDKSIYDELFSMQEREAPNKDSVIINSMSNIQCKQSDNAINQKNLAQLRPLFFILFCILITALVTAIATFFATKHNLSDKKTIHTTECSKTFGNDTQQQINKTLILRNNETIHSHSCSREFCPGNCDQTGLRFSRTELYYQYYMSDDNTTLSNFKTDETSRSVSARFLTYRGTISDICIGGDDLIYYEVNYNYTIKTELANYFDRENILEVGIAARSNVDKYKDSGAAASGWSFKMYYTKQYFDFYGRQTVNIHARHNGINQPSKVLFTTYTGEELRGQLKVFINIRREEFTVLHNDLKVYVFDDVKSNETLCPVFGVYNPDHVNVQLKILNSFNFSMYPW